MDVLRNIDLQARHGLAYLVTALADGIPDALRNVLREGHGSASNSRQCEYRPLLTSAYAGPMSAGLQNATMTPATIVPMSAWLSTGVVGFGGGRQPATCS